MLAVRGVKTYYGNIIALKGVDIDVKPGRDRHADRRQRRRQVDADDDHLRQSRGREGTITYDGRDITNMPTHEIARWASPSRPKAGASSRA
jgi:branched-chain amino acid transport system ATP-binding protein